MLPDRLIVDKVAYFKTKAQSDDEYDCHFRILVRHHRCPMGHCSSTNSTDILQELHSGANEVCAKAAY
jgi:hypothetical protein